MCLYVGMIIVIVHLPSRAALRSLGGYLHLFTLLLAALIAGHCGYVLTRKAPELPSPVRCSPAVFGGAWATSSAASQGAWHC